MSDVEVVAWRRVYLANLLGGVAVTGYLVVVSSEARDSWWQAVVSFVFIVVATAILSRAVAGRIRFEYTVISDPVNEAARLTELAKSMPGRVLASAALLAEASAGEARLWDRGDDVVLRRGRSAVTGVATPIR